MSAIPAGRLPELANVYWRPLADSRRLDRAAMLWMVCTTTLSVPFVGIAGLLIALSPVTLPIALIALAHAWVIPELYAARGTNVVRPRRRADTYPERRALGLLGDLLDHRARELHARTSLALEAGSLGVWLVGEAGALLVRPGGRRVHCYCIGVSEAELPAGDRVAHLLLALRADERGFATVANAAFVGATWRVRRRLAEPMREALDSARREASQWPAPRPSV